jgi:aminopeptidase N
MTETKELANAHVQAASLAFNRVIDSELLRPYVQKYFDSALAIWELHTFKIAEYLLVNLFPIQLADEATAAAARTAIADPKFKAIPALHRILVENLDNLERALKCQKQSK